MRRLGNNPKPADVSRALDDLARDLDAVRSGRFKIGANIDMRGYRITGLPTPEDATDPRIKGDDETSFAPLTSTYIVAGSVDPDLPNERLLAGSSSITLTDAGAGSTMTISATQAFFDALYQPLDATLTSLAALGTAADRYAYTTGIDTWAEGTITAFARTILDDADAATVRATIGAGTGGGSVTSVDGSGGTTGLTLTGGPITTTGTLTLGGTLAVANGGTGSTTASDARTALGLAIGTNVQAWDADLDSWAAVARATAFDTFAATALGATTTILVGGGVGVVPVWTTATGTGAPARAGSPTFTGTVTGQNLVLQTSVGFTALFGADVNATTLTDVTRKFVRVAMPHYTNAEEPFSLFLGDSNTTTNVLNIGGGASTANAATSIHFYVGATSTTVTGTQVAQFDSASFKPGSVGGASLGTASNGWSSIYLNEPAAGADTAQIIAPALAADIVLTTPAVTGTLATLAGTETLSAKTLTDPQITDGDVTSGTFNVAAGAFLNVNGQFTSEHIQDPQTEDSTAVSQLAAGVSAKTLSNGANDNVTLGTSGFYHRITGPTLAFSVSGVVAPTGTFNDGRFLILHNTTSQIMTIVNNATSTAANRFLTNTGADVVTVGAGSVMFVYSSTDSRWIMIASAL